MAFADTVAAAQQMGWSPGHPFFNRNPLDLCDEATSAGVPVAEHIVSSLQDGTLTSVADDPDDPANFPRCLTLWRAPMVVAVASFRSFGPMVLVVLEIRARRAAGPVNSRPGGA